MGGGDQDAGLPDSGSVWDGEVSKDGGCEDPCGPMERCCEEGEECVNDWQCLPICENLRCGENSETCCGEGEICLDGVDCAADCVPGETLCGEQLETCCASGDVCLKNECVTPGVPCGDNFDCLDDTWYCEAQIGRCLPLPSGPLCEGEPTFMDIEPVLEWFWAGTTYGGLTYQNIMTAPVVGDVNGDGTPDVVVVLFNDNHYTSGNLIAVLDGAGDGQGGGSLLFTIPSVDDPSAPMAKAGASPALANFDADPGLEIVYNMQGGGVRIADNDGVGDVCDATSFPGCSGVRTTGAGAASQISGGIAVSDLNADGTPDVVIRCHALDGRDISDPGKDFVEVAGCGYNTVVADLDLDGRPEIVEASHAITVDPNVPGGEPLWTVDNGIQAGYVAVADLLPDVSGPEVVNIRGAFYVLDGATGAVLIGPGGSVVDANIPIPGSGNGGAPTVADFDGDGLPEVSTAGLAAYVVYDPDCWSPPARAGGACASGSTDMMLWTTPTQDLSSSSTGSSVFDFQGDGVAEVLYADECFFHIYDGLTGDELVDPVLPSSSGTLSEYPLVADVDGDGNAEMVLISSDYYVYGAGCDQAWKDAGLSIDSLCEITDCITGPPCTGGIGGTCSDSGYWCDTSGTCRRPGGTPGVRVYGDANDRWVRTRPVWNQFSYHVTNFTLQSGWWDVPDQEAPNWTTFNNYRQNVQGGALFPVPNLQIQLTATTICPTEVRLVAEVTNTGSAGARALLPITFYRTDAGAMNPPEWIETVVTDDVLLPGQWERVSVIYPTVGEEAMTFRVVVDENDADEECNEDDNVDEAESAVCPGVQ